MKRTGNKKAYLKRQGLAFLLAMVIILSAIGPVGAVAVTEETTVPTTTGETVPNETQEITPISEGETTPAQETTAPTEETAAPTVETTAATEAVTEATEAETEATEAATEATEAVTEPTEETTETTEEATEPTEETVPETTEETVPETTEETVPEETILEESGFVAMLLTSDVNPLIANMTQVFNLDERVFNLILDRNKVGVKENIIDSSYTSGDKTTTYKNTLEANKDASVATYAAATKELNVSTSELAKWIFEPSGTPGVYYVKSAATGKYMNFSNGEVTLDNAGTATRVYGYTVEKTDANDATKKTYVTLYALVQRGADDAWRVLNQLGGVNYKGFGGYAQAEKDGTYETDKGNLFLMKEAYYEAPYNANVVNNPTTVDATVKLFNYTAAQNEEGLGPDGYTMVHSTGYGARQAFGYDNVKGGSVDGVGTAQTYKYPKMSLTLGDDGYPKDATYNKSFDYLFDTPVGTMTDGGGLFQKINGYYVYDSIANAAWYDQANNKFVLYDVAIAPPYTQTQYNNINFESTAANEPLGTDVGLEAHANDVQSGNFLPFNQVTSATAFNEGTHQASGVPRYSLSYTTPVDMWFGMTVEFDFLMPTGGMMNGSSMEFDFHGDDDVFVYIDGVLVLDIGGTHGAESANINFATGAVTNPGDVYDSKTGEKTGDRLESGTLRSIFEASGKYDAAQITEMFGDGNTFVDWSRHNLKFYYMERGGNISYCRLKYNMIPLPAGGVDISKQLTDDSTTTGETADDVYTFRLVSVTNGVETAVANSPYSVMGETRNTNTNGEFTLSANQVATFSELATTSREGQMYRIYENSSASHVLASATYTGTGNGTSKKTDAGESYIEFTAFPSDLSNSFSHSAKFTNKLNTTDFSVTKQVKGNMGDLNKDYAFIAEWFYDKATADRYYDDDPATTGAPLGSEEFTLKSGATKEFKNIPLGAYVVVTEADYNEIGYVTTNTHGEGRVAIIDTLTNKTEDDSIEFINEKNVPIDTGISLNSYPFILLLSTTLVAAFVLLMGKVRYGREY